MAAIAWPGRGSIEYPGRDSTEYRGLKDGLARKDGLSRKDEALFPESRISVETPSRYVQHSAFPMWSRGEQFESPVAIWKEPRATRDVLLVSRDSDVRALIDQGLRDVGNTVDTAVSAEDALMLLRQGHYWILILDLLPEVRGHELLHALQASHTLRPSTIIVLPSDGQEAAVRTALDAGADDYMSTPIEVSDVIQRAGLWRRRVEPASSKRPHVRGLQIHTLGRFCVEHNGQVLLSDGGRARKACTLFKFLLTQRGRYVPSSTIHDLLWPHVPESTAATDLRSMLYQLRRLLKVPAGASWSLDHAGTTVRLRLGPHDWWDAGEFSTWLGSGARLLRAGAANQAIAAFRAGLALYKGDYLENDLLDDWTMAMRNQFGEEKRQALEALAALHGDRGDYAEQEHLLRLVLSADPYREHTYRALMMLLASHGRSAEALVLYRELRRILQVELDSGPDPQTQALAMQIRQPV